MAWFTVVALALLLAGCGSSGADLQADALRLRLAFEPHQRYYLRTIGKEISTIQSAREWSGRHVEDDREFAVLAAERYGDRLRKIHLDYKIIKDALQLHRASTEPVKEAHQSILAHLLERSLLLQDYGSDFYRLARIELPSTPLSRVPPVLVKIRARLELHQPTTDAITPILDRLKF